MSKMKRGKVEVEVTCDNARLYAPLDEAIAYLTEVRNAHPQHVLQLEENWIGYEDMEMRFVYWRDETDAEMEVRRKELERQARETARLTREVEKRKAKMAQLNKLKRELGI